MSGMFQGTFNHDSATPATQNGDFTINGDLIVTGTLNTGGTGEGEVVDAIMTLNFGETGAGVGGAGVSGFIIDRGTSTNYEIKVLESTGTLQCGLAGSLANVQRGGDMTANYIPFGHASGGRLIESANFTFDDTILVVTANAVFSGAVGIGIGSSLAAKAHIRSGGAVSTVSADANTLMVENSNLTGDNAGISIVAGATGNSAIHFGKSSDTDIARIDVDHNTSAMSFMTNATVTLTLDSSNNVNIPSGTLAVSGQISGNTLGIGISSSLLGTVHIVGSSATGSVSSVANDLVIENATTAGITFLSATAGSIYFADAADENVGIITYNHSANEIQIEVNGARALTIDNSQNILPGTTETQDLGSASLEWDNIYVQNTVTVSDKRRKRAIVPIEEATTFLKNLTPVTFAYKDTVIPAIIEEKDEDGNITRKGKKKGKVTHSRPHTGFIAQEVKKAMTKSGLSDWAGYTHEEDNDLHLLRMNEFIGFLVAGFQEIEKRVKKSEGFKGEISSINSELGTLKSNTTERLTSLESKELKNGVSIDSKDGILSLKTSNSNSLTICKSGQIGVGTVAPEADLHVIGDTKVSGCLDAGSLKIDGVNLLEYIAKTYALKAEDAEKA